MSSESMDAIVAYSGMNLYAAIGFSSTLLLAAFGKSRITRATADKTLLLAWAAFCLVRSFALFQSSDLPGPSDFICKAQAILTSVTTLFLFTSWFGALLDHFVDVRRKTEGNGCEDRELLCLSKYGPWVVLVLSTIFYVPIVFAKENVASRTNSMFVCSAVTIPQYAADVLCLSIMSTGSCTGILFSLSTIRRLRFYQIEVNKSLIYLTCSLNIFWFAYVVTEISLSGSHPTKIYWAEIAMTIISQVLFMTQDDVAQSALATLLAICQSLSNMVQAVSRALASWAKSFFCCCCNKKRTVEVVDSKTVVQGTFPTATVATAPEFVVVDLGAPVAE